MNEEGNNRAAKLNNFKGKIMMNLQEKRKNVKKILIRIIKRKDAEAAANAKTQIAGEAEQTASVNKDKVERRLRREIVETISNWIPERNKNNRAEEIDAVRKFFGSELLLSEI